MKNSQTEVIDLSNPLPLWATAALYFSPSAEYVFVYRPKEGLVTSKFLRAQDVAAAFSRAGTDSGWIPHGILRTGQSVQGPWSVYIQPAQMKTIAFEGDRKAYRVPLPPTILIGLGSKYYLFAVPTIPITENSSVFYAPFPNVYDSGLICWGNSTRRKDARPCYMPEMWELFFETHFNDELDTNRINRGASALQLLKGLACKRRRTFPRKALRPYRYETISSMIIKILTV